MWRDRGVTLDVFPIGNPKLRIMSMIAAHPIAGPYLAGAMLAMRHLAQRRARFEVPRRQPGLIDADLEAVD